MKNSTEKFVPSTFCNSKLRALISDPDKYSLAEQELEAAIAELAKRRSDMEKFLVTNDKNSD